MKLGRIQLTILKILSERRCGWTDRPMGCGWFWGSRASTRRILESLVKKGLVDKAVPEPGEHPQYTISAAGRAYLAEAKNAG